MVRKQGAEHQRSKLPAQSERLEAVAAREREADAEQQQDLPVAGDVEKPVDEAPRRQQREQGDRPRRRRRALREAEHRDGGQILHDEDPDRDAAVERAKLAFLVERLRHHHGAGEPEGAGDEQRGDPAGAEPVDDEDGEHGGGNREVDERGAPDLGAHDVAQAHLHPHREQHEQHAGVRDGLETVRCGEPGRVEGESRREKADERRHAERAGGEAQDERAGDVDPDHGQPPALRCRRRTAMIIEGYCRRFKTCRTEADRSSLPDAKASPVPRPQPHARQGSMDARFRGNDGSGVHAVIPAKAGHDQETCPRCRAGNIAARARDYAFVFGQRCMDSRFRGNDDSEVIPAQAGIH